MPVFQDHTLRNNSYLLLALGLAKLSGNVRMIGQKRAINNVWSQVINTEVLIEWVWGGAQMILMQVIYGSNWRKTTLADAQQIFIGKLS